MWHLSLVLSSSSTSLLSFHTAINRHSLACSPISVSLGRQDAFQRPAQSPFLPCHSRRHPLDREENGMKYKEWVGSCLLASYSIFCGFLGHNSDFWYFMLVSEALGIGFVVLLPYLHVCVSVDDGSWPRVSGGRGDSWIFMGRCASRYSQCSLCSLASLWRSYGSREEPRFVSIVFMYCRDVPGFLWVLFSVFLVISVSGWCVMMFLSSFL